MACLQTIAKESPVGGRLIFETHGIKSYKHPSICGLQDKKEGRSLSEGKGTKFRDCTEKRRQDKIKAEAKREKKYLWTEKQLSVTLIYVELKIQSEIFPSWGSDEP